MLKILLVKSGQMNVLIGVRATKCVLIDLFKFIIVCCTLVYFIRMLHVFERTLKGSVRYRRVSDRKRVILCIL